MSKLKCCCCFNLFPCTFSLWTKCIQTLKPSWRLRAGPRALARAQIHREPGMPFGVFLWPPWDPPPPAPLHSKHGDAPVETKRGTFKAKDGFRKYCRAGKEPRAWSLARESPSSARHKLHGSCVQPQSPAPQDRVDLM